VVAGRQSVWAATLSLYRLEESRRVCRREPHLPLLPLLLLSRRGYAAGAEYLTSKEEAERLFDVPRVVDLFKQMDFIGFSDYPYVSGTAAQPCRALPLGPGPWRGPGSQAPAGMRCSPCATLPPPRACLPLTQSAAPTLPVPCR
jgi:hypothetical protein